MVLMSSRMHQKTDGLLNFSDFKRIRYHVMYWIMALMLLGMALICLVPVIWVFLSGFKETAQMYSIPPTFFPDRISLSRVTELWNMIHLERYIFNSIYIIIGCWLFDILFNGLAGYVLSKVRPKGSALLETVIFWTMMLPGMSMVPLYLTFLDVPVLHVNLLGTFWPMWLMAGANAFDVFLARNFFNGIPTDYFEAARIDGCGNLGIFFRIVLPMSKPLIAVMSISSVTGAWGSFMWPYVILGNTAKEPVSVMLYQMSSGAAALQDNQIMLLMTLSIIPPLILFSIFSKHIMGGFNMSGIKG